MTTTAEDNLLLEILHRWQRAENTAVGLSARVMERTANPLIRIVAEIIQSDSLLHHRVQQMLVDDIERGNLFEPGDEEFEKVWQDLTNAIEIEDKFIDWGERSLETLKARGNRLQVFLLSYLLEAERQHKSVLESLKKLRQHQD